jgi:hypothetical protein
MINCWGDVPFLDETNYDNIEDISSIKREAQTVILSKLIQDLLQAEQNLPDEEEDNPVIFSTYFAQLILSKIYTYQKDYATALQYTSKVIASNKFALTSDYLGVFNDKNNRERITQFVTFNESENNQNLISLIKKGEYMPLARYATILLLAAENNLQTNKLQEAITLLNELKVRNSRSLLEPGATATQITEAILEEYKLDLGKEGLYFFALKRFDAAESVLNIASYQKYLPIPYDDVIRNPNITQNAGY